MKNKPILTWLSKNIFLKKAKSSTSYIKIPFQVTLLIHFQLVFEKFQCKERSYPSHFSHRSGYISGESKCEGVLNLATK